MSHSLAVLNSLEDRVFALVKTDEQTGRMDLAGSSAEMAALRKEALASSLESCTSNARDELVLMVDQILSAKTGAEWRFAEAYRSAVESCEDWLLMQASKS